MKRSKTHASRCVPMPYRHLYTAQSPGAVFSFYILEPELRKADLMLHALSVHQQLSNVLLASTGFA